MYQARLGWVIQEWHGWERSWLTRVSFMGGHVGRQFPSESPPSFCCSEMALKACSCGNITHIHLYIDGDSNVGQSAITHLLPQVRQAKTACKAINSPPHRGAFRLPWAEKQAGWWHHQDLKNQNTPNQDKKARGECQVGSMGLGSKKRGVGSNCVKTKSVWKQVFFRKDTVVAVFASAPRYGRTETTAFIREPPPDRQTLLSHKTSGIWNEGGLKHMSWAPHAPPGVPA